MDLLGLVKEQFTGAVVSKIGDFLGESHEGTTSAMGSVLPMILGGLMQKGASTQGAGDIMNMLKNDGHDGSILDNLGGILGGDNSTGLLSAGSGILGSLFGDKIGGIASLISSVSGLKGGSASSLMSLAAPILMGVLGKQVNTSGLGVSGLASLLMGQKDAVKAALPAGADQFLNMSSLGDFVGGAKETAVKAVETVVNDDDNGGGFNFWPWLLAGALALGAAYYFKSCRKPAGEVVAIADSTVKATTDTLAAKLSGITKKLSTGIELNFGETSIENDLIGFIDDAGKPVDKTTWFNFRALQFNTGSSDIKAESMKEVDNIAEILKAYPNVSLKVGGYTDNVGKEASNVKLSAARATNVVKALVGKGIAATRLEAEGYGSQFPVGSNDTEEGRAQNRRIAVRVTKK